MARGRAKHVDHQVRECQNTNCMLDKFNIHLKVQPMAYRGTIKAAETIHKGSLRMTDPFKHMRDMGADAPRLYIIATGAGAGLQDDAWRWPGISNFLVGASMPYDTDETADVLGFVPEKFVSTETAIDLAMTAYMRAWVPGRKAIGLGMTCSVTSTKPHRGEHRIIAAVFTDTECWVTSVVIPKGDFWDEKDAVQEWLTAKIEDQRVKDGLLADEIATNLLAVALDIDAPCCSPEAHGFPTIDANEMANSRLFSHPFFRADRTRGVESDIDPLTTAFFPGAFNPPHDGHFMAGRASVRDAALDMKSHRSPVYSTTVDPPHKAALNTAEILQRVKQMRGHDFLVTKGDPLYIDKARRFPGAYFIFGADAMDRMLDPKWGVPVRPMLDEFHTLGTRFLVPGRLIGDSFLVAGRVMSDHMDDVLGRTSLFVPVDFRLDLSSTELRAKSQK